MRAGWQQTGEGGLLVVPSLRHDRLVVRRGVFSDSGRRQRSSYIRESDSSEPLSNLALANNKAGNPNQGQKP